MTLKEWREQNRLSQRKLGELLGVSDAAVGRYERGMRIPEPDVMLRIVEVTGGLVTPNDFYAIDLTGGAAATAA